VDFPETRRTDDRDHLPPWAPRGWCPAAPSCPARIQTRTSSKTIFIPQTGKGPWPRGDRYRPPGDPGPQRFAPRRPRGRPPRPRENWEIAFPTGGSRRKETARKRDEQFRPNPPTHSGCQPPAGSRRSRPPRVLTHRVAPANATRLRREGITDEKLPGVPRSGDARTPQRRGPSPAGRPSMGFRDDRGHLASLLHHPAHPGREWRGGSDGSAGRPPGPAAT